MKVLQINNFEHIGGGSDRVYQLTCKLLIDAGHAVASLSCGEAPFDGRKHTVLLPKNGYVQKRLSDTLRNAVTFIRRPEAESAIDRIVRDFRPDIAHLHIFYGQLSSAIVRRLKAAGVPMVMTVHEYRMLCPVSTLFTPRLGVCERCASGGYLPVLRHRCNRGSLAASALSYIDCRVRDDRYNYIEHIDHFLMVSRFCLDKHVEYRPAIGAKSSVLYNFVDLASNAGVPDPDKFFLYCGRLSQEKGLELLCECVAQRPATRLRIAGDGPMAPALRARYGSVPNIRFLGKLDAQALSEQIRLAWFTVAPSEWYENNPMAILESMAQGTPVLGADIGGIPELVIEGQSGLLFKTSNADALQCALDTAEALTPAARQAMAAYARSLVEERHSAAGYLDQLLAVYGTVARTRGEPQREGHSSCA
jgi:glycosyltransferase involved in cell wall biosynthesis